MAILSLKRVALAFILGGVVLYAGSQYWLATRKLVPLDIPISLSRGHIRTPEFSINMDSGYDIAIEVTRIPSAGSLECLMLGCYKTPAILKAEWTLSIGGQAESSGSSDGMNGDSSYMDSVGRVVGNFKSSGGRHRLNVDVLSDLSILNEGEPRLKIQADGDACRRLDDLRKDLPVVSGMLVSIGGIMLVLLRSKRKAGLPADLTIFAAPGAGQQGAGYLRRRRPRSVLFSRPPSFAFIAASVLLLVVCPVWNTFFAALDRQGIWVLTSARSRLAPRYEPGSKPLTLQIDKQRRWFFEGEPVSPVEFPAALRRALKRRPDPFVCVDADPGLDYQVPGQAMDMLQGMFVKIIIATPNAKDDGCTATIGR